MFGFFIVGLGFRVYGRVRVLDNIWVRDRIMVVFLEYGVKDLSHNIYDLVFYVRDFFILGFGLWV